MGLWSRFRQHRTEIKAVHTRYGWVPYPVAARWAKEDAAFIRLVDDTLSAAIRGVDVSFMNSCPDLHRLAVERERER